MFSRISGVVLLMVVGTTALCAQTVPVTAKTRETFETSINGKVVQTHVQEGIFLRQSSGFELRQWTKRDGKDATGEMAWGVLSNHQSGINYKVDYKAGVAHQQPMQDVGDQQSGHGTSPSKDVREDSVEGVPCAVVAVRLVMPGKGPATVGSGCHSVNYDLELKWEMTYTTDALTGKSVHTSYELYDIHIGQEPDPKPFDLTNLTIYKPDSGK